MEVIIAVAVITTALVASIALISFTVSGATASKSKLIAANLAQEGLEIVRNIRDTGWFQGYTGPVDSTPGVSDWREIFGEQEYRVEYNNLNLLGAGDSRLYINAGGFYDHNNSGISTPFHRTITIEWIAGGDEQIKVISKITWSEKGRNQNVQAETRLYNWYAVTP